ncbi:MAG TPA: bacillithiol biosynthesis BshC, partial [Chitinophagales bacterium]|nr:bacillithiol biosynthesis BshC [Chitinophagales bacterium]
RERIVLEGNQYKVLNTDRVFSQEEILAELETHPERFSPNVILRPLFQQMMLPSVMYIGGGGEVSYWLQLRTLFAHFGTAFPQLMVRNSFMLVKEQQLARMEKLGLTIQDFFRDVEELKKAYIGQNADEDIDVSGYKQEVEAVFTRLQELAKSVDVTLGPVAGAEMQKALQSVEMIQKRMMKALKQKNETALNQIEKLKTQLFPQQSLQERVENFAPYFAQSGQSFIDAIIADTDLYQRQFIIKTIV